MENHGKYGDTIYFHGDDTLYVNLFIPSELTGRRRGLVVRQETTFPNTDTTRLTFPHRGAAAAGAGDSLSVVGDLRHDADGERAGRGP